jgi:hypothetical protein
MGYKIKFKSEKTIHKDLNKISKEYKTIIFEKIIYLSQN